MSVRPNIADPVTPDPPVPPEPVPPLVTYIVASIVAVVAILVGQGFIDNRWEKLIEGLAAILIPFAWMIGHSITHAANTAAIGRVAAARHLADATEAAAVTRAAGVKVGGGTGHVTHKGTP